MNQRRDVRPRPLSKVELDRRNARLAVARRLRRIVKTHEEKHGPTFPTTDAPGWVAARDILTDLAALVEELR